MNNTTVSSNTIANKMRIMLQNIHLGIQVQLNYFSI